MDAWTLARYRRPFLAVDAIRVLGERVTLRAGDEERIIHCEDSGAALALASGLEDLRSPDDARWRRARNREDPEGWDAVLEHVDHWSMIREATRPAPDARDDAPAIGGSIDAAERTILARTPSDRRHELRAMADGILRDLDREAAAPARSDPNFCRGVLRLLCHAADAAPPTAGALRALLARVAGRPAATGPYLADDATGLFDVEELRVRLTAMAALLPASLQPSARRRWSPAPAVSVGCSGSDLARDVEAALRAGLASLGLDAFVESIRGLSATSPLVVGCYVEEFHVTRRFVEMITPLLAASLSPELRALAYRYYAEEVGHEAFECAVCEGLGVDPKGLARAHPLPLHAAFVDCFTHVARTDPLSFFAAVGITEGMLGEASPLSDLMGEAAAERADFARVYRDHEQLNDKLNHAAISRLALHEVTWVPASARKRLLEWLAFLLELNTRAWEGVQAFYGAQVQFAHHGWLSQPVGPD